jgi:hypothetical protein
VIPETLVGIVAFVAAAGPGYLYVQLAERYGPRRDRSNLEEAAELLVVGAIATGTAFLVSVAIVGIDAGAVDRDAGLYALNNPWPVLGVFALTIAFSYGAVWFVTAKVIHRGKAREIQPGGTLWYAAFKQLVPEDHGTVVTIETRSGSAYTGLLGSATADDHTTREILLIQPENRPIYARAAPDAEVVALSDTFVILRAEDISLIAGSYRPVTKKTGK